MRAFQNATTFPARAKIPRAAGHGGPAAIGRHVVTEGDMNGLNWNSLIQALVLVRIGQELGTESRLARAIHDVMRALVSVWQ
jgi:hypothetical protein